MMVLLRDDGDETEKLENMKEIGLIYHCSNGLWAAQILDDWTTERGRPSKRSCYLSMVTTPPPQISIRFHLHCLWWLAGINSTRMRME